MKNIDQAWNALRATLQNSFSFYDIKKIVGLAGFDLASLAHLEQRAAGGASKRQLMTGVDRELRELDEESFKRFIAVVGEEVLQRRPDSRESLENNLSRLGWTLSGNAVIRIALFDASVPPELPSESQHDLMKAAQRLRDGDLSGAISSACGALDVATAAIYSSAGLGDPTKASFQDRCKRSLEARGVIPQMEQQLRELGWNEQEIMPFRKNFWVP